MRILFSFFAMYTLCLFSCKKDEKASTNTDQLTLLTSKSWKPSLTDKNSSTNPAGKNIYHATMDCEKDDRYLFSKSNKLTISKGAQQCNSNEEDSALTNYSVDFNAKKISVQGTNYTLAEVSATQLKYYAVTPSVSGYENIIFLFGH